MKIRVIILFLLPYLLFYCSPGRDYVTIQQDLETKDIFERTDIHKGIKDDFLFYISNDNSEGDIWLYNLDSNSKWQITSVNNKNLQIISISTFYKYVIYTTGNKNIIYDIDDDDEMDYDDSVSQEYNFSAFQNINWVNEEKFYFLSSTNQKIINIFKAQLNENKEWSFKRLYFPDDYLYLNEKNIYSLSLSYNKKLLAFIAKDSLNHKYVFIWDLNNSKIKKLVPTRKTSRLIWSENNTDLYYYENYFVYSINLNGAKNLVISQSKPVYQLIYYPKYKHKFIYITSLDDYFYVHLKNIDYIGEGNFLFNAMNLKNASLYQKSDLLFYDNKDNEIYCYNLQNTEIRKILNNASLYKLSN